MVKTEDGSRHEGHFRDGIPSGFGIRALRDGRRVIGRWEGDDISDGSAVVMYPDGRAYTGGLRDLLPHGHGQMAWKGGCFLAGTWIAGRAEGRFLSAVQIGEKESFFGDYKEGELVEGTGIQMNSDGTFFAGAVVKRVRHGTGYDFDRECKPVRGGLWEQGKLVREGPPGKNIRDL
jgi:hypothetical protein